FDPSFWHLLSNPIEGVQITNNILWVNDDHNSHGVDTEGFGANVPNCPGSAKSAMDCAFVQGPGHTSYSFSNNVLVPYYANSQAPSGNVDPNAISAAYAGLPNVFVQQGAQPANRLNGVGFMDTTINNFRLNSTSPYLGRGTDLANIGVDMDKLEAAQGNIG